MPRTSIGLRLALVLIVCAVSLRAQQSPGMLNTNSVVPPLVSFSGVLTDGNGKAMSGVVGMTFALYRESQGGSALWIETQNVYSDETGRYTVLLGSTSSTGLPADLFVAGEARWLGVQVQGQAEKARVSLLSVPYALKAGDAQTIGGLPPSAFVLATPPVSSSGTTMSAATAVPPMAPGTTPVTTAGGTVNVLAKWDAGADITNSQIFDNGTNVGIGTSSPTAKLDVKGTGVVRGLFTLPQTANATASKGANSQPLVFAASAFNSGKASAVTQNFRWQAEPTGNNTAAPSGTLNLLFGSGTTIPAETGLKIASNGQITFAPGQTFPGSNGSVTSVALTAPSTDFIVTGSPVTSNGTLGLGWLVAPDFNNTANAIVKRDSSGNFSAGTINAASGFNLGGTPFAFGSRDYQSAFLGFSGNPANTGYSNTANGVSALSANTSGSGNTASGEAALLNNTTGYSNTATGVYALLSTNTGTENTADGDSALYANTTGYSNTASGGMALYSNTTGHYNTAGGMSALYYNTTGSSNTALGANAGPDQSHPGLSNTTAIGAFAQVTQSNSLVLGSIAGVNGASASTNVGIGTTSPQYALDVQGAGRFAQPIIFASNQTFPGSGTITGVTAGTDLMGGGSSGNVTLSLDTSKVPQLGGANIFTGSQTVNGNISVTSTSGTSLVASGGYTGLYGTGANTGVFGTSPATTGYGVHGQASGSNGYGILGESLGSGGYGVYGSGPIGVYGLSPSSVGVQGNGVTYGVFGYASSSGGIGVYGENNQLFGYGLYGKNTSGTAVYGYSTGANTNAVRAQATGANSTGISADGTYRGIFGGGQTGVYGLGGFYGVRGIGQYGVEGEGQGSGATIGVYGSGIYGLYGQALADSGQSAYGVYGASTSYVGTYAGYFYGPVNVTGSLSKGGGTFKIDHPLDPANKYLYHSFVESPDMMNVYNGNIILDGNGTAWVTLPEYFEALNRDFRYQLTAIGVPGPNLYVAEEISNNRFRIAGGTPGGKISWQVTGVRHDAFAKAHPVIPEVEKTKDERGKYLYPSEHGQAMSMGIDESQRESHVAAKRMVSQSSTN